MQWPVSIEAIIFSIGYELSGNGCCYDVREAREDEDRGEVENKSAGTQLMSGSTQTWQAISSLLMLRATGGEYSNLVTVTASDLGPAGCDCDGR